MKWAPPKEINMSPAITEYFKTKNYEVYGEVFDSIGVIDHVAKKTQVLIAIEMKLICNLQLIFQGLKNTWSCNYSYIVFPFIDKYTVINSQEMFKVEQLCKVMGIGILQYGPKSNKNESFKYENVYISEYLKPKRNSSPKFKSILLKNLTVDKLNKIGGITYSFRKKRRKKKRKKY